MSNIPSYTDWLNNTSGGVFSRRGPFLRSLDEKIQQRRDIPTIKAALEDYLAREDVGPRNGTGMIDKLIAAVGLGPKATDSDFGVISLGISETIPDVIEPPNPIPVSPPVVVPVDPWLESEVEKVFTIEITPADQARPLIDIQARRDIRGNELAIRLTSMNSDLIQLELEIRDRLVRNCINFTLAIQQGMEKFKELHLADAQDKQFKITIAKGIFGALESLPFPLSVLGKAGGALAGMADVDTNWGGFKVTIPSPGGIKGAVEKAAKIFKDTTTLNVQTDKLTNHAGMMEGFIRAFNKYTDDVLKNLEEKRKAIGNDASRKKLVQGVLSKFQNARNLNTRDLREVSIEVGSKLRTIDQLVKGINKQFEPLKRMPPIDIGELRLWITVQLIADYAMTGLCDNDNIPIKNMTASDLGGKGFGEPFAKFLYSNEIKILELKETSGTTVATYARGRIPWEGRLYDVIAVMLFLEWFQRNINPFDLLRPDVTSGQFRKYISDYIKQLGIAMEKYQDKSFFRKTVSSVQDVNTHIGR